MVRRGCRNAFCDWWKRHNSNVVASILALGVYCWFYMAFVDSNHPVVLESEVRGDDGKPKVHFKPGETIYVFRHWCVNRLVTGDVDVEIYHIPTGQFYYLGNRAAGAVKGCSKRTSANRLPMYIPDGHYEYRAKVTYAVNPLRTIVFEAPAVTFEVIK